MEQVFEIFGKPATLAREIGAPPGNVRSWKRRNVIPAKFDLRIVAAAQQRGYALTLNHLALLRAGTPNVTIPVLQMGAA